MLRFRYEIVMISGRNHFIDIEVPDWDEKKGSGDVLLDFFQFAINKNKHMMTTGGVAVRSRYIESWNFVKQFK